MSLKKIFEEHPNAATSCSAARADWARPPSRPPPPTGWPSRARRCWSSRWTRKPAFPISSKQDIFGKGPVKIMENLWAQEIDADQHIKAYQNEIRQKILDMYGFDKVPEEIEQYIQAASAEPAMEESAIFDAVVDIVVGGDYDYYIYDLVPLGHALYYLSMAKVYDEWINKITKLREEMREYEEMVSRMKREKETEEDQILTELQYIRTASTPRPAS